MRSNVKHYFILLINVFKYMISSNKYIPLKLNIYETVKAGMDKTSKYKYSSFYVPGVTVRYVSALHK